MLNEIEIKVRLKGKNVKEGDTIVASFATNDTVALVGGVFKVSRIEHFDARTGELEDPRVVLIDQRTGEEIVVERREFDEVGQVDGPFLSHEEVLALMKPVSSGPEMDGATPVDEGVNAIDRLYRKLGDKDNEYHVAVDNLLDAIGVDSEERIDERIEILKACARLI